MLNKYFQEELAYLRELGREFSQAYPLLAPMLGDKGADPDVERLLEGVAFLTGRIRQKLDDEIPEAIHSITSLLFPHFLRPLPGTSILEFAPVVGGIQQGLIIAKGTEFASREVEGVSCRFASSIECTITPWTLEDVRLESLPGGRQQLRLAFHVHGGTALGAIAPEKTRLHFAGDLRASLDLLMWVHTHLTDVVLIQPTATRNKEKEISLGKQAVEYVGLGDDEALLPVSDTIMPGLRLLTEYFTLPQKFAFIDVAGIGKGSAFGEPVMRFDLAFRLDKPFPYPANVDKDWVRLHCVPIVNVFPTTAEPIRVEAKRERYLVRPAGIAPEHADVYSIRLVETLLRKTGERFTVPPFLSFARTAGSSVFYVPHLVPSAVGEGADMMVSFGTHEDGGLFPDADVISMEILATNRALASALRPGEITAPTSTSPPMTTFRNLTAVTPYVAVPIGRELHWRMLAHAAMGLTSFAKPEVLRAALDVYNLTVLVDRQAARANELRMEAIKDVRVTPAERLVRGAIVRGVDINVDAEEAGFLGDGDLFLFSAVLDRLYASYVSINSFSRTAVNGLASKQRYAWPARNGNTTLL